MTGTDEYSAKLKEELSLYDKNNPSFQFGRLAGNIATPVSAIPGSIGAGALPRAASILGFGGLAGGLQPTTKDDFWKAKAGQVGVGAATAPILPLAGKALGGGKRAIGHLARPATERGIKKDLSDFFVKDLTDGDYLVHIQYIYGLFTCLNPGFYLDKIDT